MTKAPGVKPIDAPTKDGPFGCYMLPGWGGGRGLKFEVRNYAEPMADEDGDPLQLEDGSPIDLEDEE